MNRGFSLLELLIVLTITSILASMAYPSYRDSLIRTHRIDGQMALLDLASRMEQYYSLQSTYQTATIETGQLTDVLSQNQSPEGWYQLEIVNASDSAFTLQATPIKAQATSDLLCQSLTFMSSGVKGITSGPLGAPKGQVDECW